MISITVSVEIGRASVEAIKHATCAIQRPESFKRVGAKTKSGLTSLKATSSQTSCFPTIVIVAKASLNIWKARPNMDVALDCTDATLRWTVTSAYLIFLLMLPAGIQPP